MIEHIWIQIRRTHLGHLHTYIYTFEGEVGSTAASEVIAAVAEAQRLHCVRNTAGA